MKRKINYVKHWAKDGTVYSQTVHITNKEYGQLIDNILAEQVNSSQPDNYEYNLYLKQPVDRQNNLVFINLTQRDFFNRYLKVKLLDRNTCFQIS